MPSISPSGVLLSCSPGIMSITFATKAVTTKVYAHVATTYANWIYNCLLL